MYFNYSKQSTTSSFSATTVCYVLSLDSVIIGFRLYRDLLTLNCCFIYHPFYQSSIKDSSSSDTWPVLPVLDCGRRSGEEEGEPGSAIHHQVEGLFTAGVKVPGTCLQVLSEEPLLLNPVQAAATLKIISNRGPPPSGQKKKHFNQIQKFKPLKDI